MRFYNFLFVFMSDVLKTELKAFEELQFLAVFSHKWSRAI